MKYNKKQFEKDLQDPKFSHTKTKNRFADFYNELGKMPQQKKQKYVGWRMDWIEPDGEILELGCHVGFNLIYYARKGFNITGVDLSQSLIDEARKRISKQPREVRERITIVKSFIEKLKVEKRYDTILLTETLEHVINPIPIMKKTREFLKRDGKLYITSPDKLVGNSSHVRGISRIYVTKLLASVGMKPVHFEDIKGVTAVMAKIV